VNSCIKIAIDVLDKSVYTFLILLKYNNVNYNYSKIIVHGGTSNRFARKKFI